MALSVSRYVPWYVMICAVHTRYSIYIAGPCTRHRVLCVCVSLSLCVCLCVCGTGGHGFLCARFSHGGRSADEIHPREYVHTYSVVAKERHGEAPFAELYLYACASAEAFPVHRPGRGASP